MNASQLLLCASLFITACSSQTTDSRRDAPHPDASNKDHAMVDWTGGETRAPTDVTADLWDAGPGDTLADSPGDTSPDMAVPDEVSVDVVDDLWEPLPPYAPTAFVGTDGRHFRDHLGRVLLLHGTNASNVSKSAPFFPQWLTQDDVSMLADRGFNVVRLLVIWEAIEPQKGEFDQGYLDMIEEKVSWFTKAGLYVLLDMHQDLWGPKFGGDGAPLWATLDHGAPFDPPPGDWFQTYGEPAVKQSFQSFYDNEEGIRDHFILAWQEVAKRFADNPMVIGYDIINEPFTGNWDSMKTPQFEAEVLTPFYTLVAEGIREVDKNHIIFVEPTPTKGLGLKGGIGPIGDDKVAYAAHYYHLTMDILKMYSDKKENMLALFQQIRDEADVLGGPAFLGEFGFYAGFPGAEIYAEHQLEVMEELGISWTIWGLDRCHNGFCLLGPEGQPLWPLNYATQTFPQHVAGRILSWHYNRPVRTMTLTFDPDGVTATETVIFVPARNYPLGVIVTCTTPEGMECTSSYSPENSLVTIVLPTGSNGPHQVTVAPATSYPRPIPGLSTHTSLGNGTAQDQELSLEAELGVTTIRTDFKWSKIEKVQGQFTFEAYDGLVDHATDHGIEVVAILDFSQDWAESEPGNTSTLDPSKFAAFAGAVAAHFADRITHYEIWNEANIERFWHPSPDPAAFATLLKAAAMAVRANDPTATVIYGGLASTTFMETGTWPFLFESLHVQPDLGHYFDQLAIHPYTLAQSLSPEQPNPAGSYADSLAAARQVLARFGLEAKPIVITEMGWPACPCPPLEPPIFIPNVSYQEQAEYLVRAYLWSWAQGIGAFHWYDFYDGSGNADIFSEDYFGLMTYDTDASDGLPPDKKPAYFAYQTLISLTANRTLASASDPQSPCAHFALWGPNDMLHILWQWEEEAGNCTVDDNLANGQAFDLFGAPTDTLKISSTPLYLLK